MERELFNKTLILNEKGNIIACFWDAPNVEYKEHYAPDKTLLYVDVWLNGVYFGNIRCLNGSIKKQVMTYDSLTGKLANKEV